MITASRRLVRASFCNSCGVVRNTLSSRRFNGQFVEEEGIAHRWTSAGMLEMDDRDLLVLGGGRFGLDLARQTLELWGDSQVYGRFNHSRLLEKIASADHPWSGFKLSIF
jgi:hypothetical protein